MGSWQLVQLCPGCGLYIRDAKKAGLKLGDVTELSTGDTCDCLGGYQGQVAVIRARYHEGGWFSDGWWEPADNTVSEALTAEELARLEDYWLRVAEAAEVGIVGWSSEDAKDFADLAEKLSNSREGFDPGRTMLVVLSRAMIELATRTDKERHSVM